MVTYAGARPDELGGTSRRGSDRAAAVSAAQFIGAVAALTALGLARILVAAGSLDRVWAEDGQVFLSGALRMGFPRAVGASYDRYLLVLPRLLSQGVAVLPIRLAGSAFSVIATSSVALLAVFVYAASSRLVASRSVRCGLALAMVLLPVARVEVVGDLANLQWALLLATFWALVMVDDRPALRRSGIALAALSALSCPIALVYVPLAAGQLARSRNRRERRIPLSFLAGCAVQVVVLVSAASQRTMTHGLHDPFQVASHYLGWVGAASIVWPDALVPQAGTALLGGLLLVAVLAGVATQRSRARRGLALLALGYSVATFAAPVFLSGTTTRYAYAPALLLLSAIAVLLPERRALPTVAVAVLVGLWMVSFPAASYRVSGPTWSESVRHAAATCSAAKTSVRIPVSPNSGRKPWGYAEIPCSRLPTG